jgi:hypothetical protein
VFVNLRIAGCQNWLVWFNEFLYQSVLMVLLLWGFECCVGVCCGDSTSLRVARMSTDRQRGRGGGCLVYGDYKFDA